MFKEYLEIKKEIEKELFLVEGFGRSMGGYWKLPVSNPMGYFISVFPDPYRPRMLEWFMTDGLVKASQGRDELVEIINRNIGVGDGKLAARTANLPANARVAEAYEQSFLDVPEGGVYPTDLFSPEARQRLPFLNEKQDYLDGKTVDEYFEANFEPHVMRLQHGRGQVFDVVIKDVNTFLRAKGFPEFRYGGVQGYLQFVEKGAWLPRQMQRAHTDPNGQHGPDLSRASHTTDDQQRPIVQFQAGAVVREERKFRSAINDMQFAFNQAAEKIQANRAVDNIAPEDQSVLKGLLSAVDTIKRIEKSPNSHVNIAEMLFGIGRKMQGEEGQAPDAEEMYDLLMKALDIGLQQPFEMLDADSAVHGDKIGAFSEEGYQKAVQAGLILPREYASKRTVRHGRKVDSYVYQLGPKGIELAKNYITQGQPRPTVLKTKIRWRVLFGFQGKGEDGRPLMNPNMSVELSTLINRGFEMNPELYEGMALVGHELAGAHPERFMREPPKVNAVFDLAKEKMYADAGYRWELPKVLDDYEATQGRPNWKNPNRDWARMVFKVKGEKWHDQIKVMRDTTGKTDAQGNPLLYAQIHVDSHKQTAEEARKHPMLTKGLRPAGMLLGGRQVTASRGLGHVAMNPVRSREEWNHLLEELLQGQMGEPIEGEVSNPQSLPSVVKGALRGISRSASDRRIDRVTLPTYGDIMDAAALGKGGNLGRNQQASVIDAGDVIQWALDGLWGFSGDRAFQIGYIDPEEIKWNQEQELQKIDDEGNPVGRGLFPILSRSYEPEDIKIVYSKIQELVKQQGYTWDTFLTAAEAGLINDVVLKAIGENAFEARVEAVANHVSKRIEFEYKRMGGGKERQGREISGGGEGRARSYTDTPGAKLPSQFRSEFDAPRDLGRLDPTQAFNLPEPEPEPVATGPKKIGDVSAILGAPSTPSPTAVAPKKIGRRPVQAAQPALAARELPPTPPAPPKKSVGDVSSLFGQAPVQQPAPRQQPKPKKQIGELPPGLFENLGSFPSFKQWREFTWAPYDGTVPKDGCGFNWWGAVGHPMGVSIEGDPIGSKPRKRRRKNRKE